MANELTYVVDVLATSQEELNLIMARLKEPSPELINSAAREYHRSRNMMAERLRSVVGLTPAEHCLPTYKTGMVARFSKSFKQFDENLYFHLYEVSKEFPSVLFLVESLSVNSIYSSKRVLLAGNLLRDTIIWMPVDIFVPFRVEYERGVPFGSLWERWLAELGEAVADFQREKKKVTA